MSIVNDIRMKISELEDTISCLEAVEEFDEDCSIEIHNAFCRLAALRDNLEKVDGHV